jgi:hypothetical protein
MKYQNSESQVYKYIINIYISVQGRLLHVLFKIFRASIENELQKNVQGAINVDHADRQKTSVFPQKVTQRGVYLLSFAQCIIIGIRNIH